MIKFIHIFILFYLASCARVKTINLKPHTFNSAPSGVIHLVVPGLSEEHFLFLDDQLVSGGRGLAVKDFSCFGNTWSHNLTNMRTGVVKGVVSQMTGVAVTKNKCEEFSSEPMWDKLAPFAYKSALLERGSSLFDRAIKCEKDFFKNTAVFTSANIKSTKKEKQYFHFQEEIEVQNGVHFIDKSCANGECFSSLEDNFFKVWNELKVSKNKYLMITDYSVMNSIKKRNKKVFLEEIKKLNSFIEDVFKKIVKVEQNVLFVLSSSQSMKVILSKKFSRESLSMRRMSASMTSPIWAYGPQAENFCGSYPEYEVLNRVLWQTKEFEIPFLEFLNL